MQKQSPKNKHFNNNTLEKLCIVEGASFSKASPEKGAEVKVLRIKKGSPAKTITSANGWVVVISV